MMRGDSEAMPHRRWRLSRAAVVGFVVVALLIVAGVTLVAHRERQRKEVLYVSCRIRLYKLVELFGFHIEENGGMPYAASLPGIVDPMCEGWSLRDQVLIACPFNAEFREGRMVDSGLRTLNWPSETWTFVREEVCQGKPATPLYLPGEVPAGYDVPPGLMIAWTSQPVSGGRRYVQILPVFGGGFTQDDPLSSVLTSTYLLDEREFDAKMQEIRQALAAMRQRVKQKAPNSPPAKEPRPPPPGGVGHWR